MKPLEYSVLKNSNNLALEISFGEAKAQLEASVLFRGRDVLALDCFQEKVNFQKQKGKGKNPLLFSECEYGTVRAKVSRPAFQLLKISADLKTYKKGLLEDFGFILKGSNNAQVFSQRFSAALPEWPSPGAVIIDGEDALALIPDPKALGERKSWGFLVEAENNTLRCGANAAKARLLDSNLPKNAKVSFYLAAFPSEKLFSSLAKATGHVAAKNFSGERNLEELCKEALKKLPALIDATVARVTAPSNEAEKPASFGNLLFAAYVLENAAKEKGKKAPTICQQVLALYEKAPTFKGLKPAFYPYSRDFKKSGEEKTNLAEIAKAAYFAHKLGINEAQTKETFNALISKKRRGAFIPASFETKSGRVNGSVRASRQNPFALLFVQEIAETNLPEAKTAAELWPALLNSAARAALKRNCPLTAEEALFGAKACLTGFDMAGRVAYRALGVKYLWRSLLLQQLYQPPFLSENVLGLLCQKGSGDFALAPNGAAIALWQRALKINGAKLWKERIAWLTLALTQKKTFASAEDEMLNAAALLLPLDSCHENKKPTPDLIIAANGKITAAPGLEVKEIEEDLFGCRLTLLNKGSKKEILFQDRTGQIKTLVLKKGKNLIEF